MPDSGPPSLDRAEINSGPPLDPTAAADCPSEQPAVAFRHSGWARRRQAVACALSTIDGQDRRLDRFNACGTNAWVQRSTDGRGRLRVVCDHCHDRWCDPCAAERRRLVCRNLARREFSRPLRMLTLTLRADRRPLTEQLDRLYKAWRLFRCSRQIKPRLRGGVCFLELTCNHDRETWHPHLHVLFEGSYLPQPVAKRVWFAVTGDSYIVDVRQVGDARRAAQYVAKYASKALSAGVYRYNWLLTEAIIALHRRRTFATFGTWRGLPLLEQPPADEGWEFVGRLAELIRRAEAGDDAARGILRQLRQSNEPTTEATERGPPDGPCLPHLSDANPA